MPWLVIFLYGVFLYTYGAKLSSLLYTDFPSFYYGARLAFVQKQSPYDEAALTAAADRAEPPRPLKPHARIYPFLYPPSSLLIFYPMARLSPAMARLTLLAVNHLCLAAAVLMLLLPIAGFTFRQAFTHALPAFGMLYLLYSRGTTASIDLGQVNLLILALLCLAWWGIKARWNALLIGVPLGLACIFKFYPILFVALLAINRRWGAIVATIVVIACVSAISCVMLPRGLWQEWLTRVLPTSGYLRSPLGVFPPTIAPNIGVAGFMARLFLRPRLMMETPDSHSGPPIFPHEALGRSLTFSILTALCLLTFGVILIALRQNPQKSLPWEQRLNLSFSAILLLTFLVAPLAWDHHLAYVAPAVVIAVLGVVDDPAPRRFSTAFVLALACVIGWPMSIAELPLPRIAKILLVSLKLYAILLLWIFILYCLLRPPGERQISRSAI